MLFRMFAALAAFLASTAFAQAVLYGTVNASGTSTLVRLDPATGALLQTIGPVGYVLNGLAFDPTTGMLYGSTSSRGESGPGSSIVTISTTTGAATVVGPTNQSQVATIAFTPNGTLYGWSDLVTTPGGNDDLVVINKATGAATWVGDSGLSTYEQTFAINANGTAYLLNGAGDAYTINLSTGAATPVGSFTRPSGTTNHHGAFNPANGLLYVIDRTNDSSPSNPRNMSTFNTATNAFVGSPIPIPNDVHTLAFLPKVAASVVPANETWALMLLVVAVIAGSFLLGRRRTHAAP
ncbi:MAG: hypothetical protein JNL19_00285 [Burkholderiales bacterium]|nr:hypothetical protein [Burkholderiales bacterium]